MIYPRQCAILVGGLGTRLGKLTATSPKPLLELGGRPFLTWILRELVRYGFEEIVLLAGYKSEMIDQYRRHVSSELPKSVSIRLSTESVPAGTGGAIWHARDMLDELFVLINGDSWFDTNLVRFFADFGKRSEPSIGSILLVPMEEGSRYGTVEFCDGRIVKFREKSANSRGPVNTGIYIFSRKILDLLQPRCSLEWDILPFLAQERLLAGHVLDGYFIDVGVPADYSRAQAELTGRLRRPAVFFDRDGVLNEDSGWIGNRARFRWMPGALDAIRYCVDYGHHVFVVTNQAGVAKGLYTEADVVTLHRDILHDIREHYGNIDDIRYCPYHPQGVVDCYRKSSTWRKPNPGMIVDLVKKWEINVNDSILIGDKQSDLEAARSAGIRGVLYSGGDLASLLKANISPKSRLS